VKFRSNSKRNKIKWDTSPLIGAIKATFSLDAKGLKYSYCISPMSETDNPRVGVRYNMDIFRSETIENHIWRFKGYFPPDIVNDVNELNEERITLAFEHEDQAAGNHTFNIYIRKDILQEYPFTSTEIVEELIRKIEQFAIKC
jgi:hypothetical protein